MINVRSAQRTNSNLNK